MIRASFAVHEADIDDANQLARCIGRHPDDDKTYGKPGHVNAKGERFAFASALVGDDFAKIAMSPLSEPEWGCDIKAAMRAQALVVTEGEAAPGRIVALFGVEADEAMRAMGLRMAEDDPT